MNPDAMDLREMQFHRKMAVDFFNETWKQLDKAHRTLEDDTRMIHTAHASRLHWEIVGSAENLAVGEWLVSRVHSILQQPDSALFHAWRSLDVAEQNNLSLFHLACSHEAIARALSISHQESAVEHIAMARKIALEIVDPEEKTILNEDLSSLEAFRASEP
jgi:hypothetical protein